MKIQWHLIQTTSVRPTKQPVQYAAASLEQTRSQHSYPNVGPADASCYSVETWPPRGPPTSESGTAAAASTAAGPLPPPPPPPPAMCALSLRTAAATAAHADACNRSPAERRRPSSADARSRFRVPRVSGLCSANLAPAANAAAGAQEWDQGKQNDQKKDTRCISCSPHAERLISAAAAGSCTWTAGDAINATRSGTAPAATMPLFVATAGNNAPSNKHRDK